MKLKQIKNKCKQKSKKKELKFAPKIIDYDTIFFKTHSHNGGSIIWEMYLN